MKIRVLIIVILMLIISSGNVIAKSHLDLFSSENDRISEVENLGYKKDFLAIYDDEPNTEGFQIIRYVDDRDRIIVNCKIQFFTDMYSNDYANEQEYKEMLSQLKTDKEKAKNTENNKWISYFVNSDTDIIETGLISNGQQYFRTVIDGPVAARYMVRTYHSSEEDYETLVSAVDEYVQMMIKHGKAINSNITVSDQSLEETEESLNVDDPLVETKDETKIIEYEIKGKLRFVKGLEEKINKSSYMPIKAYVYDENGNLIDDSVPVITDEYGGFKLTLNREMNGDEELVITTALAYIPSGEQNSIGYSIRDASYDGGTKGNILIKLFEDDLSKADQPLDLYLVDYNVKRITKNRPAKDAPLTLEYALSYIYLKQAIDFYEKNSSFEFDNNANLTVLHTSSSMLPNRASATYNHLDNNIYLSDIYNLVNGGMNSKRATLFHEFSHFLMYNMYGNTYPEAIETDSIIGIYANESTAHSLTEGFAYFMQQVILEETKETNNEIKNIPHPIFGTLEPDYITWMDAGLYESRAVAGVLYDLYDDGDDGETISIPIKEMLNLILETKKNNVGEVYEAFISQYPNLKDDIDNIFIKHGFYAANKPITSGLGKYEFGEAYFDQNMNFKYDEGEEFIDFNATFENGMKFQDFEGEPIIGNANYFSNENRKSEYPNQKMRVKINTPYKQYKAHVTFTNGLYKNYTIALPVIDGYIYLPIPSSIHNFSIELSPSGLSNEKGFVINSEEIRNNLELITEKGFITSYKEDNYLFDQSLNDLISEEMDMFLLQNFDIEQLFNESEQFTQISTINTFDIFNSSFSFSTEKETTESRKSEEAIKEDDIVTNDTDQVDQMAEDDTISITDEDNEIAEEISQTIEEKDSNIDSDTDKKDKPIFVYVIIFVVLSLIVIGVVIFLKRK